MSDYCRLNAQPNIREIGESEIFLTLENPRSDSLEINWKIKFPFPVIPLGDMSGKVRLESNKNTVKSWRTDLDKLTTSQREKSLDQEIEVELNLAVSGEFFRDGIRSSLKQLY